MARTWSVRLRGIVVHACAAKAALQTQADLVFLGLGILAHLCISLLGAWSLAVRMAHAGHPGSALFDPSVVLFLLAGTSTALLLLHMSRSMALSMPDRDARHHRHRATVVCTGVSNPAPPMAPAGSAFDGLLDTVGHELRTPLNAIIGFSELMQRELLGPLGSPRYHEYVRHIRDSGLALLKAAEDTMALTALLADPQRARSEAVDLDALLDEACSNPDVCKRGVRIGRGARCATIVQGESAALRQSLSNLLAAAVLRAPERHPIWITTRVVEDTVRLCVSFADKAEADARSPATRPSLAVARMLFELQGLSLMETQGHDGTSRLTVALPIASSLRSVKMRAPHVPKTMAIRSLAA